MRIFEYELLKQTAIAKLFGLLTFNVLSTRAETLPTEALENYRLQTQAIPYRKVVPNNV